MSEGPDATAVRTAMRRALHAIVDEPPLMLDDTVGLRIAGVDGAWRERPDMDLERTRATRASIVARAWVADDLAAASNAQQYVIMVRAKRRLGL